MKEDINEEFEQFYIQYYWSGSLEPHKWHQFFISTTVTRKFSIHFVKYVDTNLGQNQLVCTKVRLLKYKVSPYAPT